MNYPSIWNDDFTAVERVLNDCGPSAKDLKSWADRRFAYLNKMRDLYSKIPRSELADNLLPAIHYYVLNCKEYDNDYVTTCEQLDRALKILAGEA